MTTTSTKINPQVGFAANAQAIVDAYRAKLAALKGNGVTSAANAAKPNNPAEWNNAPPRNVRSFQQSTNDVQADSPQTARNIGDLIGGKTRLNIFSAMTPKDSVDFYTFNLKTTGKVGASVSSDKGVHVQLIQANGKIVADSEATTGEKADNYKAFQQTSLYLDKGAYYLKVTRSTGELASTKPNYAIQLSMGKNISEDYDTIESPAQTNALYASTNVQATANVSSILDTLAGGNLFDFLA